MDRIVNHPRYCGKILSGHYGKRLKRRVAGYFDLFQRLDDTGIPVLCYLSAWHDPTSEIWYEFISSGITDLLACRPDEVAGRLRTGLLNHRVYRDDRSHIHREVADRREIDTARPDLREATTGRGYMDAVYQVRINDEQVVWLKDLAAVESHEADGICLSLGHLTVVTKEMRSEEERITHEKLQASLELAGAICHELNQPLQALFGYAENLKMDAAPGDPMVAKLEKMMDLTDRMGGITRKLMHITRYETRDYVRGVRIVDIDKSAGDDG